MDLMSPSKDVLNAHIPYVYLVAISSRLLRGTLDDSAKTGKVSQSTTVAEWLQYSSYISISWCSMHPKQTRPCTLLLFLFFSFLLPPTKHQQSLDSSEMRWLKTQLAELPKCAAGALLCSLPRFLLRGEAGGGWRRFDHLGECGPQWLLRVRWEDNSSQLRRDECLTWANELPGRTELHHACFL